MDHFNQKVSIQTLYNQHQEILPPLPLSIIQIRIEWKKVHILSLAWRTTDRMVLLGIPIEGLVGEWEPMNIRVFVFVAENGAPDASVAP